MTRTLFLCSCPGQGSWLPHTCLICQSACPPSLPVSLTPACPLLSPSHRFYLHASREPPGLSLPCKLALSVTPLPDRTSVCHIPCDSTVPAAHLYLGALCTPPVSLSSSGSLPLFSKSLSSPHFTCLHFSPPHPTFSEDRSPPPQTILHFLRLPQSLSASTLSFWVPLPPSP